MRERLTTFNVVTQRFEQDEITTIEFIGGGPTFTGSFAGIEYIAEIEIEKAPAVESIRITLYGKGSGLTDDNLERLEKACEGKIEWD